MALETLISSHEYFPGSAMAPEPIPFPFLSNGELTITLVSATGVETPGVIGVDCSLSGNGAALAATITALRAFEEGARIVIARATEPKQKAVIKPSEPFPARAAEEQLDRQTMMLQELRRDVDQLLTRSWLTPRYSSVDGKFPVVLPGGLQGWSSGTGADGGLRTDLAADEGAALVMTSYGLPVQDVIDATLKFDASIYGVGGPLVSPAYNATTINSLMQTLKAFGGGELNIPTGVIWTDRSIIVPTDVTLKGKGNSTQITATNSSIFVVVMGDQGVTAPAFRARLQDLQIVGGAVGLLMGKGATQCCASNVLITSSVAGAVVRGNYNTSRWTASISGTTMTVTAMTAGSVEVGRAFSGTGVAGGTYVVSQLTGTTGGVGTYRISAPHAVASTTMTTVIDENLNNKLQDVVIADYQIALQTYHLSELYLERVLPLDPRPAASGIVIDTATAGVHLSDCNSAGAKYPLVFQNSVGFTSNVFGYEARPNFIFANRCLGDSAGGWRGDGLNSVGINVLAGAQLHFVDCWASGSQGAGAVIGNGGTNDVTDIIFIGGSFTLNAKDGIRINGAQAYLNLVIDGGAIFHGNGYSQSNTFDDLYIPPGAIGVSIGDIQCDPGTGFNYTPFTRYAVNVDNGASDYIRISPLARLSGLTAPVFFGSTGTHNYNGYGATTALISTKMAQSSVPATGTTVTPYDNTVPQVTEGTQFASMAVQAKTPGNRIRVRVNVPVQLSTTGWVVGHLHLDGAANAFAAAPVYIPASGAPFWLSFTGETALPDTSAHTITLRIGPSSAATLTYNPATLGGVLASTIETMELS